MNKIFLGNNYLKRCFFIIFVFCAFFLPITTQAVGDKGCCIKDTTKKTEDKNNCEQNAIKINCSAPNKFFIDDDPQCGTPIAMSYCGNPSKENDLGCCVKDTTDSKNFGSSNCQSNQKRSACSGKLFEASEPDCSGSVSKYCNAENKQQAASHDGLVPCGGPTDPCTICHLIVGIGKLVDYGKSIVVTIAIVAIFIAGIMYMVSTGNEQLISKAKSFLGASLIGFAAVLAAWLIVDVTILWIANADPQLKIGVTSWHTFECDTSSSALSGNGRNVGIGPTTPASPGTGGNCAGLPTQPNIDKQCKDASAELNTLLSCIQKKLGNRVTVSSISDGNGGLTCYEDHPTWPQCTQPVQSNCCYHSKGSLHYNKNGSRAADLVGSGASNSEISSAVTSCNGKALNEGNHIHASI